jgi:hypothetical protein
MPTSAKRPNQEPHDPDQRGLIDPIGIEPEECVEWCGSATTTTPGTVPRSRDTSVDPHRER